MSVSCAIVNNENNYISQTYLKRYCFYRFNLILINKLDYKGYERFLFLFFFIIGIAFVYTLFMFDLRLLIYFFYDTRIGIHFFLLV